MHDSETFTCLDFFAGSGLVAEGLKPCFRTAWANDVSEKKADVFLANHKEAVFVLGPIEDVSGEDIPTADLSWGSFPCQDLSLAGNMSGLSAERSGLVWHWLRVMDELKERPPVVVAENVVGLVSAAKGEHYRVLHHALVARGYRVGSLVLDAASWLPQSRKRVFVIAVDEQIPISSIATNDPIWCHPPSIVRVGQSLPGFVWWHLPRPQPRESRLEDIIEIEAECFAPEERDKLVALIPEPHQRKMAKSIQAGVAVFPGYKRVRHGKQVLELRFDGLAGCLRTPQGGSSRQYIVIDRGGRLDARLLTVKETAALMGAPSHYKIPGSYNDGYRAMGDAVAVPVTSFLARELLIPILMLAQKQEVKCQAI